ncbi:BrnT family toxin [Burkholderia sp. Ax-1724]|uniref:BrnT family toxin n=1 Tax=Burkholderia sp. Ax-1724 TaxID=2608336 RepID=UPI00142108F5|nr:BrnT family toxin [Burkholderia sp. Ax-1724]NIF54044.1 BrnT family toxin [Burkholderia sp. Ax-1724]
MKTTYDRPKSVTNEDKHGVPLALAEFIDWTAVWCAPDDRKDYGELREIGYAVISSRLYCVVFTQRGETFRIISLRKANNREIERYEQAIQTTP